MGFRDMGCYILRLIFLINLTITHMALVHERVVLSLNALVLMHILIVVFIPYARGAYSHFEISRSDSPRFPCHGLYHIRSNGEVQKIIKTSSGHMVKCWIPKIFLTKSLTFSHTM
jgi:hypothetical protein